jgi:hypothetical protein
MTSTTPIVIVRRGWRYQRGNQNPYIEEEQTTQRPKENKQKDKQWSTKHIYKTKDRVTYKLIYYLVCICSGVSLYSIQHYVIKFVNDLRQIGEGGFSGTSVSSTNNTDRNDITEWNIVECGVKHHSPNHNP